MNWRDRRKVLLVIAAICGALFVAGIGAALLARNDTICSDGKDPVAERDGVLGQVVYQCHNGQIVTMNN